jgi:competence protein ComEA
MVLKKVAQFTAGLLIGLLAAGVVLLVQSKPLGEPIELLPPPTPPPIRVHICGAVARPGVVVLPPGAILAEAIEAAGGPLPGADLHAVNLANPLRDGDRICLTNPATRTASPQLDPLAPTQTPADRLLIDINQAPAEELETLPGIGPVLAANIIEFRRRNGPFQTVDQLLDVPGIGPQKLEAIRPFVTIDLP